MILRKDSLYCFMDVLVEPLYCRLIWSFTEVFFGKKNLKMLNNYYTLPRLKLKHTVG